MKTIQLLNLASERNSAGLDDRWQLPLNHIWLGTYLQSNGYDVEIFDTNITPLEEIIPQINAPILGISFFVTSAHLLERVTRVAKEKGCFVVVGGQAATPLARQILCKNKDVDVVVCGDGEEALLGLTRLINDSVGQLEGIPNLAYRNGEHIVFTEKAESDITKLPIPDRRLPGIEIEKYISNFATTNTDLWKEELRATNAYVKKGCPRRVGRGGCSFCARIDQGLRSKSALQAYQEYSYLIDEFGINYIYDDSDSWIQKPWLKEMASLYEIHGALNTRLRIYADLKDINEDSVQFLKTLGVDAVLIGVESGDEWISRINGKPVLRKRVIEAARLLGNAGIKLWDAYVLGLMGETKASVRNTRSLALDLHNYCEKTNTYWSMIQPLPGSKIWTLMMNIPELQSKYGKEYVFNMEELQRNFIDRFCDLGPDGYFYLLEQCKAFQVSGRLPWRKYIR